MGGLRGLVQGLFERLTLPGQVLCLGGLAAAVASAATQLSGARPGTVFLTAGACLLGTAAGWWPAWRARRAHQVLTKAAQKLAAAQADADTPDDDSLHLPYLASSEELHRSTLALRRVVDLARQQRQALQARNAQLGVQLQSRTEALGSLQDLSLGLAQRAEMSAMSALVGEALQALERALAFSSASVWARARLDPRQPVVLMGFRSHDQALGDALPEDLTGLRLSRANLQRYEQIESDGRPIVENRPSQNLLSWLWSLVTDDARTSQLYRSTRAWMAVPLKVHERVVGVLRVDHGEPDAFDAERGRLLSAVGSQTALAMRHAQLLAEQREQAVISERNRIARDLHDAVSQTLFASILLSGSLTRNESLPQALREQLTTLERLNRSALAEMRVMLFELRPDALEGVPLAELLQHTADALAGRGQIEVKVQAVRDRDPPLSMKVEVYRIAQEAVSNAGRHSGARHVHIGWSVDQPGQGRLHIIDDGSGFDPTAVPAGHFGLENMRQRATAIGAELMLSSKPDEGTELMLQLQWR